MPAGSLSPERGNPCKIVTKGGISGKNISIKIMPTLHRPRCAPHTNQERSVTRKSNLQNGVNPCNFQEKIQQKLTGPMPPNSPLSLNDNPTVLVTVQTPHPGKNEDRKKNSDGKKYEDYRVPPPKRGESISQILNSRQHPGKYQGKILSYLKDYIMPIRQN